ncbi:MAG: terminase small subunit [Commensalibacter sp.]
MVKFSSEKARQICQKIMNGESLVSICQNPQMPSSEIVIQWLSNNIGFRRQFQIAREAASDHLASQIVHIADQTNIEDLKLAQLRIDARKWVANYIRNNHDDHENSIEAVASPTIKIEFVEEENRKTDS